jgi:cell division septation protein DedD
MWYLTLLTFGVAAVGAWFFFKKASPDGVLDVNKDGKVNMDDVKAVADVNKDGKVTDADAKAAVTAVVEQVKVIAAEAAKPEPVPVAPPAPVVVEPPKAPPAPKTKKKAAAPKVASPKVISPKALVVPAKKATKKAKKQWPT